jgi:phosphatidylserine/phosphatidylglycerophosphate/cardiolipin synthase-like enzyme
MRFKSAPGRFQLFAVTGTHTIAFAIDCNDNEMIDLLGFTVEKEYTKPTGEHIKVTVMGFKVFKERIENPVAGALYSTYDNPIQSFTWEDFTADPETKYTYHFTPLYDHPENIRRGPSFQIEVETEPLYRANDHSVFFNRGVASSQAYTNKFGNKAPSKVPDGKAFEWLSRGLKEAMIAFIEKAGAGDNLYGCFYEFSNDEILNQFRSAADRGANLHIIYDAKDNEHMDNKTGKMVESFPKAESERSIKIAKLDQSANIKLIPRQRNKSYLSHNKFMVIVKADGTKILWTGSTNLSDGGIFGQSNVGHYVENTVISEQYLKYWDELKDDPDATALKTGNEAIQGNITVDTIPDGVTTIFSPRKNLDSLQFYADLLDSAKSCGCITFAFSVHPFFEKALSDNDSKSVLTFILLEKNDEDISDYVYKNNIIKAVGSDLSKNPVYKWVKETNTHNLHLNTHVMYIHTKYLLKDPLSEVPVVATGSANFSKAATDTNDENMIIIKGNRRVADIYFTEFLRLFNHYYFRWIVEKLAESGHVDKENPAFLKSDYKEWTGQYQTGKFKRKRIDIFKNMYV